MLRKVLRHSYLTMAGRFKSLSNGIHVLNGHFVSRENISGDVFYRLLEKLKKHAQFIRIEEAASLISERKTLKDKLVAFSFDDGFEECYSKIAPALEAFKTNAAFFINPGFVEGNDAYICDFLDNKVLTRNKQPMTWLQIKELNSRGHIIGSHTLDHIRLNHDNETDLAHQLIESKKIIEEKIGSTCEHFAYPYGQLTDLSEMALKIAKEHYTYVYSGADYKNYLSFKGQVINRRHFEGDWPISHLNYFLNKKRVYDTGY